MRKRFVMLVVVVVLALAAAPALAAKGGKGKGGGGKDSGSSSLSIVMVEDGNGDGVPNWSDKIRFNVTTTETEKPHVRLQCYQGGELVLNTQTGYYDDYRWPWTQVMTLSTGAWTSGAADCTATMYYFKGKRTMYPATLNFTAEA